jgi:hypothetical protein
MKLPVGQKINIGGVEYEGIDNPQLENFFKGSDIVGLMKAIPMGQSSEIADPNTGKVYTLTGLGDDPNVITATDDRGYQFGLDKITGETLWKSATPVGKTKTQAGSTTINMANSEEGDVLGYWYDNSGNQLGYSARNKKTGAVVNRHLSGETMTEAPAGASLRPIGFTPQESGNSNFWSSLLEGKE